MDYSLYISITYDQMADAANNGVCKFWYVPATSARLEVIFNCKKC